MRLTQAVFTQHLGRMFKKHWKIQGQRPILETSAEKSLKEKGIRVYEHEEVLSDIPELESNIIPINVAETITDERMDPLWHDRACYLYKNHSALLEGLDQAKLLTKTVEIESGLPKELESPLCKFSIPNQHELAKRTIMSSHVFDATQEKLPKRHDPERPAWSFPLDYGIVDARRNRLMGLNLLNLCRIICRSANEVDHRFFMENTIFSVPFEKDGDLVQLECRADLLLANKNPLSPYANSAMVKETENVPLPSLHPIKHTVSLLKENIYKLQNLFPIQLKSQQLHINTSLVYYNETEVKNLFDLPVNENQFMGRTLVHAFAVASAQARQNFGNDIKKLDNPVTIQSIHTDGRRFQFSVFQLNTMDMNGVDGVKNIIWMTPIHDMFELCAYQEGKPELVGYNGDVFEKLLTFYANN